MVLGKLLKQRRQELGWSLTVAAKKLDLRDSYRLQNWERSLALPRKPKHVDTILKVYSIDPDTYFAAYTLTLHKRQDTEVKRIRRLAGYPHR